MALGKCIEQFDTWRPGYGQATVSVYKAGTNVLASLYTNEALTTPASNPQVLSERTLAGIAYGKFAVPIYVGEPYELQIDSVDRTGVNRPAITTLDGQNASAATVTPAGASVASAIGVLFARSTYALDYGEMKVIGEPGASEATNTTTIVVALGVAAAAGGGFVELPAGTYGISTLTIPTGVVLRGRGRVATTLQSTFAGPVVTIGGSRAGLENLTLDGSTLVAGSIGLYAANKTEIFLEDVEVKRFETGIDRRGGSWCHWHDIYISNCVTGFKGYGDVAGGVGGAFQFNFWRGGEVKLCTTVGIDLKYVDAGCTNNFFSDILFDTNTGKAVNLVGTRDIDFGSCRWNANTNNITAADFNAANDLGCLTINDSEIQSGTISLTGTLRNVSFRRTLFVSVAVTLTTVGNAIVTENCNETNVTLSGDTWKWTYYRAFDKGASKLVTSGNTTTKIWSLNLITGQRVYLEGKVVGRQRNGINRAFYHIAVSAQRPGATLAYQSQTTNFTVGEVLTGGTSGATARIVADSDSGATGTLTLQDIVGTFINGEAITDSLTGAAVVNGTITENNAALEGSVTDLRAVQESDAAWAATFAANVGAIELRVTGNTGQIVEWIADVEVVMNG